MWEVGFFWSKPHDNVLPTQGHVGLTAQPFLRPVSSLKIECNPGPSARDNQISHLTKVRVQDLSPSVLNLKVGTGKDQKPEPM